MNRSIVRLSCAVIIVILALSFVMTKTTAAPQEFSCTGVTQIPQVECEALVALYNSTSGMNWTDHASWLVTNTPSNWSGVTVSGGHVTRLDLHSNYLSGNVPPQLGSLASLTYLDLDSNQLSGGIPPQLGSLASLTYLALDSNQLSGSIPPELGNLANLSDLWLKSNQLSGSIPAQLGSLANLTYMNLASNRLSGGIPPELGSLAKLTALILYSNQLSGGIPPELGSLANLSTLSLFGNQLSGVIPPELGSLASLTYLNLSNNQLSGSIPSELGSLANLSDLWLKSNQLSGSIPAQLGSLATLKELNLSYNQLSGSIPPELGSLPNLFYLYLSNNQLSGSIPPELGSLPTIFDLYLSNNHLTGSIPPELANLANLEYIDLLDLALGENWLTVPDPYPSVPPTPLEIFLMAHAPGWEITQGIVADISVSGGQVQSRDERVTLTVPAGGVSQPVTLVLTSLVEPGYSTGYLIFVHTSFIIEAFDSGGSMITPFNFVQPVTVTLFYQDSDVAGHDESQLLLYYWDDASSSWRDAAQTCAPSSIYQRDLVNNTLIVPVCHLTEFALLVKTISFISGQVTDGTKGIPDVTVSAGNGFSVVTDAAGNYTLSNLVVGTYTITPSRSGYSFNPTSQQVTITNANQTGINFTGAAIAPPEYKIYLPNVVK